MMSARAAIEFIERQDKFGHLACDCGVCTEAKKLVLLCANAYVDMLDKYEAAANGDRRDKRVTP